MSLRYFILLGCLICFVLQAAAQTGGGSAIVSVIINSESPEESVDAVNTTVALLNELDSRSLNASVFVTGDMAKAYPLYITLVGSKPNHELGLAGKSTDEDLGSVSASDMEVLLLRSKSDIESNYVCGGNSVEVKGFLPQPTTFESGEIPMQFWRAWTWATSWTMPTTLLREASGHTALKTAHSTSFL
jgi:hypothetical protein